MNRHNEEGIILRPVDFRERDRILTFLTPEQGKISGIVHGARSLKSQKTGQLQSLWYWLDSSMLSDARRPW